MNAARVLNRAGLRPGILAFAVLLLLPQLRAAEISRIYVVSARNGTRISTHTPDGRRIEPTIQLGYSMSTGIAVDATGDRKSVV